jgi:hypothetical protein
MQAHIRDEAWCETYRAWIGRGFSGRFRAFEEEGEDSNCIRMRMQAIWSAGEMTRVGIYFREHQEEDSDA